METPKDVMSHPIYEEFIKYYKYWKEYPDKLLKFCLEEFNRIEQKSNPLEHLVIQKIMEEIDQITNVYNYEIEASKVGAESNVDKLYYNGQQQATLNLHGKIRDRLLDNNFAV